MPIFNFFYISADRSAMGTYWSTTNTHTYFILCLPYLMVSILFMCIDQCFCMNKSLNSQNPPPFVTVASSNKPCLSHDTHHVLTQWNIHRRAKRKLTTCRQTRLLFFTFFKNSKYFVALSCDRSLYCLSSSSRWTDHLFVFTACQSNSLWRVNYVFFFFWGLLQVFRRMSIKCKTVGPKTTLDPTDSHCVNQKDIFHWK